MLPPTDDVGVLVGAATYGYRFLCAHVATFIGVTLFIASWFARSHFLVAHVTEYDEGIILNGANALLIGGAPYRDFYTNYPPGIFLTLAGLWKIFGVSLAAYRLLAVVIHLSLQLLAGRLAARIVGSGLGFSWLACGMVACWTVPLQLIPYAWIAGLALLALTVEAILWASDMPTRRRFIVAGAVYGLVGCFRHDLFVYFTLIFGGLLLLPKELWSKIHASKPPWQRIKHLALGASIPMALVWVPVVALAGVRLIVRDIFLDQVRYVMPGRVLPMPRLYLGGPCLPPFCVDMFPQAVMITLVAPFLVLLLCAAKRADRTPIVLFAPVTVAVLSQMLGRTDATHAVYTVLPGLVLMTAFVERIARRTESLHLRGVLPVFFALALTSAVRSQFWPMRSFDRRALRPDPELAIKHRRGFQYDPYGHGDSQRQVIEFIRSHTDRKERVFFGNTTHQRLVINEITPYFFANRLPGVRWSQFDPNLVTSQGVQEEMIASMERFHVRVVVISSRFAHLREHQPPVLTPSPLFDLYLKEHFTEQEKFGVYTILTRDM